MTQSTDNAQQAATASNHKPSDEQYTKVLDVLDAIELQVIKGRGTNDLWPQFNRLHQDAHLAASLGQLAKTAADVAVFGNSVFLGAHEEDQQEGYSQINSLFGLIGEVSYSALKESVKQCGLPLDDVLAQLPSNVSTSDATNHWHEKHVVMLGYYHAINRELPEDEKIDFNPEWNCFIADNVRIYHSGDGEQRESTVCYGDEDDFLLSRVRIPNPVTDGVARYSELDLVALIKDAFYGPSPYTGGCLSLFCLAGASKDCDQLFQHLVENAKASGKPGEVERISELYDSFRASFPEYLTEPNENPYLTKPSNPAPV